MVRVTGLGDLRYSRTGLELNGPELGALPANIVTKHVVEVVPGLVADWVRDHTYDVEFIESHGPSRIPRIPGLEGLDVLL
jgi:hypothetical protein